MVVSSCTHVGWFWAWQEGSTGLDLACDATGLDTGGADGTSMVQKIRREKKSPESGQHSLTTHACGKPQAPWLLWLW